MASFSKGRKRVRSRKEQQKERHEWHNTLEVTLSAHTIEERKRQAAAAHALKKQRSSACDQLYAWDHMLQLAGHGLSTYLAAPAAEEASFKDMPTQLLEQGEKRYFVKYSGWHFPVPEGIQGKRCVVESADGEKRWEVPEFSAERPMLGLYLDEGSSGFAACFYLLGPMKCRGAWLRDPFHRAWNDWKLSCQAMGWWKVVLEGIFLVSLRQGPWLSEAWFQQMREAQEEYMDKASPDCPVFTALYTRIAHDKADEHNPGLGTREHVASTYAGMASSSLCQSKGTHVALKTWFGWTKAMEEFQELWHSMLLMLIVVGLSSGWWKDGLLPLDGHVPLPGGAEEVDLAQAGGPESKTAEQKMHSLRLACSNSLHMATQILAEASKQAIMRIIVVVSEPIDIAHRQEVKMLTTAANVKAFYIGLSKGLYTRRLAKVWATLTDPAALRYVGFEADQELWPSSDTICDDGHNHQRDLVLVLDQMCSYEAQVAKDMFNFALQLVIRDCKGMFVIVLRIVFYSARNSGVHWFVICLRACC